KLKALLRLWHVRQTC
ncbi:hypothetical protein VCHENC02_4665B, partial [Vibrio harveyi]